MQRAKVYIYGKHAIEEAQTHAPHVLKKVFTNVKGDLPAGKAGGHGGYVAIVDIDKLLIPYASYIESATPVALLILGGLTDPHNVGAIIRSAAAFNFSAVLIPKSGQAPITGAVAKTSAGMIFRIPLVTIDSVDATIADLKQRGFTTYGLAADGSAVLGTEQFPSPVAFVVGNEGAGLSPEARTQCDKVLSIPMHSRAESLNAAQAATVVMYEWQKTYGK